MRLPEEIQQVVQQTEVSRALRESVPAGGKVLERLHFFEQERDLEYTDVARAEPERPLIVPGSESGGEAGSTANRRRGGRGRDTDAEDSGDSSEASPATSPYLVALQTKERLAPTATAAGIQTAWRPLGPFAIPHGQTYGAGPGSRPPVSGRVSSIAIDPGDDSHILLGSAAGGVWETRDNGSTWHPRTDDQPALAIGAITFDPSTPSIAYAGTGEGNFYRRLGTGLLRSTDGGTTWAVHATGPFVGLGFYDLIVDRLNGNHLLAATTASLCESSDGGATWTVRRSQLTWALSMHPAVSGDPNSTKEVFAGCGDGLYRSTDGGTTWTTVALPGVSGSFQRIDVCHAPSDGNVVYVFAATDTTVLIWRRDTLGGAFTSVTPPSGLGPDQAWYDWFAAVAPNDPAVLYVGGIDAFRGVRSSTGTWSWSPISAKGSGDSIHPDQHAIAFSPIDPNVVYIGNDGGLYRSPDGGTTWRSLNKGLCITEFEYLAQHPQFDAWLIGGTQDNGTMRYEGGEVWFHIADGDGGDCGVNAASPYICYHSYFYLGLERSSSGGGWGTWAGVGPLAWNDPARTNSLFYPPMEVNGDVVVQAGQVVYISINNGSSWNNVSLPSGAGVASALAIPTSTRVYAGTTSGNIYRIDQSGGVWQAPVALTQPRAGFVSDLLVDPTNSNRIWATYSDLTGAHVFRSDDGGSAWNDVSAGLPNIPVNAIEVDPMQPDTVWVAADVGVYRSTNAGGSWTSFSNGLPNVLVADLLFHPATRLLRAGTRNRGVWEITVDQTSMPDVEVYLRDSVVDTGRRTPSPSTSNNPFLAGTTAYWWDCTDIKVDAAPFQHPSISDVDFEFFEDDAGVFAAGLTNETVRGSSRIFVQVHNRGSNPASDVAVKLFYTDASSFPPLPAGFWTNFPNNVVPAASPWQPIGLKIVPSVEVGRPQVVGFDWNAPTNTSGAVWLLAVISAANDPIATTEQDVAALVQNSPKCGLKRVDVVPYCGVQWRGSVPASATARWFTHSWPATWHVIWTVVPTSPQPGAPQIKWNVQVERASAEHITYWISVTNLTTVAVDIEGRYCVLAT